VAISPTELTFAQNETTTFAKPHEPFDAYRSREDENFTSLNSLAKLALSTGDPLTLHFISRMLEDQAASCDEVAKLHAKAKAYSALPGLFFHLNKELETSSQSFDTWRKK
jgi:ferritin